VTGDNVQMFILGSLAQGGAHGYQLLARAKKWGVSGWAGFGSGPIYNALRSLEKKGLVAKDGTEQQGRYAPATVYRITEAGRDRLGELMRQAMLQVAVDDPADLATAFLGILPVEQRQELIHERVRALEQREEWWQPRYEEARTEVAKGRPLDWILVAMEKGHRVNEVARQSAEELLARSANWGPPEPLTRAQRSAPVGTPDEQEDM